MWVSFFVMQFTIVTVVLSLLVSCGYALQPTWCSHPQCASLELLAEFVEVDYDWTGSLWSSRDEAIQSGAFVVNSSIITGVNFYEDIVFVCVPRWRSGVPATLTTLQFEASTGRPILRPYPSWSWQETLHYVQAVYVDRVHGTLWIIDTGRENFYNSNVSTVQNRAASLYVWSIQQDVLLLNVTFPDDIFPFNSSFLNDIRVDPTGTLAFMTDTNLNGLGAVVAFNTATGFMRRIMNPSTLAQPNYTVNVGGQPMPKIDAPADGIGLSPDGQHLYYSVITGSKIFRVPTSVLLDPAATAAEIFGNTTEFLDKEASSDGMDIVDVSNAADPKGSNVVAVYGGFCNDSLVGYFFNSTSSSSAFPLTLSQSQSQLEWVDTIVGDASPSQPDMVQVYFTSNRLPQYVFGTMDFTGWNGPNMRIWKMMLPRAASVAASSSGSSGADGTRAPTWAVAVMSALGAVLGAVLALYWVVRVRHTSSSQSNQSSHNSKTAMNRESIPLRVDH